VGAPASSGSDRYGTRADAVDLEGVQGGRDSYDVRNGVECADLVKMHFRCGLMVDSTSASASRPKLASARSRIGAEDPPWQ
jgi:hypothetical protein